MATIYKDLLNFISNLEIKLILRMFNIALSDSTVNTAVCEDKFMLTENIVKTSDREVVFKCIETPFEQNRSYFNHFDEIVTINGSFFSGKSS